MATIYSSQLTAGRLVLPVSGAVIYTAPSSPGGPVVIRDIRYNIPPSSSGTLNVWSSAGQFCELISADNSSGSSMLLSVLQDCRVVLLPGDEVYLDCSGTDGDYVQYWLSGFAFSS